MSDLAGRIVEQIIADLTDRRGLRQEWGTRALISLSTDSARQAHIDDFFTLRLIPPVSHQNRLLRLNVRTYQLRG